jgi:3-oxoadipate CoA-transferase, alpha subunit
MINKFIASVEEAVQDVKDGSTVLVGGFGQIGVPYDLLHALADQGARDLTIVSNSSSSYEIGTSRLLRLGRVRKVICSFPRSATSTAFSDLYQAGKIELEVVPQGTLAERLRAAGAGVGAFFTATGYGTEMAEGKECREIDGKMQIMEYALHGDVALVEAWKADRWGNLVYNGSGGNFNAVMATAAKLTLVQTQHRVELGDLAPPHIITPGIYVNRVVHVPYGRPGNRFADTRMQRADQPA